MSNQTIEMTRYRKIRFGSKLALGAVHLALLLPVNRAQACGGFFCDSANIVNQDAERIVFAREADGSVTQIVEVLYEGDAEKFAWLLPVPGTPEPGVSSVQALDALQRNTNPRYSLNFDFETCRNVQLGIGASDEASADGGIAAGGAGGNRGVTVLDAGKVGAFDYATISVDDPENPAEAALTWLSENGYDVGTVGESVLEPYLANGLNLIAFKLEKGQSTGAIQPISLRFVPDGDAEARMVIPIRPTAVAATENMPIMVWVLGEERAVPANYYGLELNDLLINWFNAGSNYNDVVIAAANEAGGQGFVTEYANDEHTFDDPVGYQGELQQFNYFKNGVGGRNQDVLVELMRRYGGYDGMLDLVADHVPLRDGITAEQFLSYPECYFGADSSYSRSQGNYYDRYECEPFADGLDEWGNPLSDDPIYSVDMDDLLGLIESEILGPIAELDRLIADLPYMTRLYTTMSADEMTKDPEFDYKSDLPTVSNFHSADAYVYCDDSYAVTLPDGTKVYGREMGAWPYDTPNEDPDENDVPVNVRVLSFAGSGSPDTVFDNQDKIDAAHGNRDASTPPKGTDAYKDAKGCSIGASTPSPGGPWTWLAPLVGGGLVLLRRRRSETLVRHVAGNVSEMRQREPQ